MKHWFSDIGPFQRDPLALFLDKAATEPGPVVRLYLGPKRMWLVTDPEFARDLLKADDKDVDKGHFVRKLKPIVGESILTINGAENTRRRRALHATFAKGVAQSYIPEMSTVIREAAVELVRHDVFSAHALTAPLTLRMFCVAMFGKSVLTRGDEALIVSAVKQLEDDLAKELFRPYPALPLQRISLAKRRKQALRKMQIVVDRVKNKASDSSVLASLIALGLDDATISDEIVTMLIAGHHTTGSAAAWILYYLARDPDLTSRIATEASHAINTGGDYTAEHLAKANVSTALVKEVLRLYPSAFWFSRDARKPISTGKQLIKKGDSLVFCPWQLHRDPRRWQDPEAFDLTRSFTSKSYMPFGAGPRTCLGMTVALLKLQLIALEFASSFEFAFVGQMPPPMPTASVTLTPPTIMLRSKVREQQLSWQAAG